MKKSGKGQAYNILSPKMQNRMGYLFLLPWLIGIIIFTIIPSIITICLSFARVEQNIGGFSIDFVGLDNYYMAFFQNLEFNPAMASYFIMIFTYTPTIIVISLILAYFLNTKLRFRTIFRTIYFFPVIVLSGPVMYKVMDAGGAATNIILNDMFVFRMINYYSASVGEIILNLFDNFVIILWFTGIPIVLLINAFQKINPALFEAAKIDSASEWQILFKITLPLIKSTALLVTIFTITQLGIFSINPVFELIQDSILKTSRGLGLASVYAWVYSLSTLLVIGLAALLLRNKNN